MHQSHSLFYNAVAVYPDMSACSVWTQLSGLSLVLNLLTNLSWCHSKHTVGGQAWAKTSPGYPRVSCVPKSGFAESQMYCKMQMYEKNCWRCYCRQWPLWNIQTEILGKVLIFWISNETKSRCESMQTLSYCFHTCSEQINFSLSIMSVTHMLTILWVCTYLDCKKN